MSAARKDHIALASQACGGVTLAAPLLVGLDHLLAFSPPHAVTQWLSGGSEEEKKS